MTFEMILKSSRSRNRIEMYMKMTSGDPKLFNFAMKLKNSDSDDEVFDEKKLYSWRNSSKGKKEVFSIARTARSQIFILSQSP